VKGLEALGDCVVGAVFRYGSCSLHERFGGVECNAGVARRGRGALATHADMNTMKPIVSSLLETDLDKFTMWQALLHRHPDAQTEYAFVCRNEPAYPLAELKDEVERELDHLCSMSFADDELNYLRSLRFIKSDFVDFLAVFGFSASSSASKPNARH
jgi:hypothetical protein